MPQTSPDPVPYVIHAVCRQYPGSHGDRYRDWDAVAKVRPSLSDRCAYFCDVPVIFVPVYSEAEEKQLEVLMLAAEIARHGAVRGGMGSEPQPCDASAGEIAVAAIEQMRRIDDLEFWPEGAASLRFDHRGETG